MEDFVNKTDVSFSQLLKKDGWFSRLIFFQLLINPALTVFYWIFLSARNTVQLVLCCISIAGSLVISFLLWKKLTRFTITVSIILLWILFVLKRVFRLLVSALMLAITLQNKEASSSLINYRIFALIYTTVLAVIALALTIIWTRNLIHLKRCHV